MSRHANIIYLSLLFISINAGSTKINYKEILAKEHTHIVQNLELLGPKALLKNYKQSNVSNVCAQALAAYEEGIHRQELWALQMMDSSSKVSPGIIWGNLIDIGVFDECIKANNKHFESEIHGQHCMYSVNSMVISSEQKFPFNPILSICIPAKCNSDDLTGLVNNSIDLNYGLTSLKPSVSYAACTEQDELNIDNKFVTFTLIMGLYIAFLSLCTIIDVWYNNNQCRQRNQTVHNLIQFSYLKNTKAIFNLKFEEGDLPAIHGLRALNTFWLIIVHEYFLYVLSPLANFVEMSEWFVSWNFLIPMVGLYCVETFFVLSGFLNAYAYFKQRSKNKKFDIFHFYLHRILRLVPSIVAVLGISVILLPKVSIVISGPRMNWLLDIFVSPCRTAWPSVMFFVQNLVEKNNYCLQHLWSVSADMQLTWISPFILYALQKTPKIGLSLLVTLFIACITSYAVILGINKHPAIYFIQEQSITTTVKAYEDIYELTYTRASPWLLGILLGYIIQTKSFESKQIIKYLGWFVTVLSFGFCAIGIKTFTNESYEYNIYWEIAFGALSKPIWGLIICWIIYSSINYPDELLNRLLSSKFFLPFSRISYSLCIVHILFPIMQVGSLKVPRYFSDYTVLQSYISNVVLSSIVAIIFSITFEMPIRNLEKIIANRKVITPKNKWKIN